MKLHSRMFFLPSQDQYHIFSAIQFGMMGLQSIVSELQPVLIPLEILVSEQCL